MDPMTTETHDDETARYMARYTVAELRAMAATFRMDRAHRAMGARVLPGRYAIAARIVAEMPCR